MPANLSCKSAVFFEKIVELGYSNVVGQDSLTRFEKNFKKNKFKSTFDQKSKSPKNHQKITKDWLKNDVPANSKKPLAIKPTAISSADAGGIADKSGMILAKDDEEASLNENRWLEIKNGDGSPKAKMSKGMTSIKQQLGEVEKFVNWYSNSNKRGNFFEDLINSLILFIGAISAT